MVLGLIAAAGVGLAGYGIFKGSRDVGKAARGVGQGAEDTLRKISKEVTEMRVFFTNTAWPEINKTLTHVNKVLDRVDEFLVTSTFATKVLALFLALCAAYMTHKLISGRARTGWIRHRNRATIASVFEDTVLQMVYSLCLVLALVLVLQSVKELFHISWPSSVPFVILIPSLTTLAVLYQNLVAIVKAILVFLRFVPYITIEVPINMGWDPVTKGSGYMRGVLLQLVICVTYLLLYIIIPYGAFSLMIHLVRSEESVLKCMLICYGVFYATTLAINVVGGVVLAYLIRPVWAFLVRRNL